MLTSDMLLFGPLISTCWICWLQVLETTRECFYSTVHQPDFTTQGYQGSSKEELSWVLESLIGIAQGTRVDICEHIFGFLHPMLVDAVKLLGELSCEYLYLCFFLLLLPLLLLSTVRLMGEFCVWEYLYNCLSTYRYTVTARMTPALRWAVMRDILMFHSCEGQSHKTVSTDHNLRRERRAKADLNQGPSAYQPNSLPLGQTSSLKLCSSVPS